MKIFFTILISILLIVDYTFSQNSTGNYYSENFESETIFDTWTTNNISGTAMWSVISGLNYGSIISAYEGTFNACFYSYNYNGDKTMLISPAIDLSQAINPVLKFNHVQPSWSSDHDALRVYYKTSIGAQWVLLAEYSNSTNEWKEETIVLPDASAEYYISFEAESGYGYGIGIDNLTIGTGIFCGEPKNISFVNIKETSALIRWTQQGNVSYEAEYGVNGFAHGTGTKISNISDNYLQLNNLYSWVGYDFYLRTYCSEGVSNWSGPFNFTTDCGVGQNLPYTESFENNENPLECWQILYANYNYPEENEIIVDSTIAYLGQNSFRFSSYAVGSPYDQYLISPSIDVPENTEISFKYKTLAGSNETFAVGFSTSLINPLSSITWIEATTDADNTWKEFNALIPENTKFIVIHYQSNYEYYLYIDDIRIGLPKDCPIAQNLIISETGINYAVLNWDTIENVIAVEYGEHGFAKGTGNLVYNTTDNVSFIENISSFTQYDAYVLTDCEGISIYSDTVCFFTQGVCETVSDISANSITNSSAKLTWTTLNYQTQYNVEYGLSGFIQGTGVLVNNLNNSELTISSLLKGTAYDVYVDAICSEFDGTSDWSDKFTFETIADSIDDENPPVSVIDEIIDESYNSELVISVFPVNHQVFICDYDDGYHYLDLYILNEGIETIKSGTEINYSVSFLNKAMFFNESIVLSYDLNPGESYEFTTTASFIFDEIENSLRVTLSDNYFRTNNHLVAEIVVVKIIQEVSFNGTDENTFNVTQLPFVIVADINTNASAYNISNNILWSTGETSNIASLNNEGWFSFTVSNEYCTTTKELFINKLSLASEEINTYEIFPNPSEGQISVNIENPFVAVSFDVYDTAGRKVYSSVITSASQTIELGSLAAGIYNVAFTENENVVLKRLFIE